MALPCFNSSTFVVSFNVLSSALSPPDCFSKARPEDCLPENRLKVLTVKLQEYIREEHIICLQELSRNWHAKLLPFFRQNGYTIVVSSYGYAQNDYMGVAIACKDSLYEIAEVRNQCVADYANWPVAKEETPVHYLGMSTWTTWINYVWKQYTRPSNEEDKASSLNEVGIARKKENTLLMLRLKPRNFVLGQEFIVGTYHMPCSFMQRTVMVLHAAAVSNQIREFAAHGNTPYILAGDFNMSPDSEEYKLMTTGSVSNKFRETLTSCYPNLPTSAFHTNEPLQSAYHSIHGKEPPFTCYATTCYKGWENDFIGPIDYIFVSPHCDVKQVLQLPEQPLPEHGASLPSAANPSDHLPIGAAIEIKNDNKDVLYIGGCM